MASEASPWAMGCKFPIALKGQIKLGFQPVKNKKTFTHGVDMGYYKLPFQGAFNKCR